MKCFTLEQEILDVFLEEYDDLLQILETELGKYPSDSIKINEIFRVFHTLKGNSATIEYMRLYHLTKYYCDYFRPKQKETNLSEKEYLALNKCVKTLETFETRIKNGKKGKTIKIIPLIKSLQ